MTCTRRDDVLLRLLTDHEAGNLTPSQDIPMPFRITLWHAGLTAWGSVGPKSSGYTLTPDGLAEARLIRQAGALAELSAMAGQMGGVAA